MGGSGAWNLVTNAPDRFAATVLVCPTVRDLTHAAHVARPPLWVFQGEADGMVTTLSRALIAAVKQAGGRPRYTEYHGAQVANKNGKTIRAATRRKERARIECCAAPPEATSG